MPTNKIAVKFPLQLDDETANFIAFGTEELEQVVQQNIKMVLMTNPGERIFDDNFGIGLRKYLFLGKHQIENGIPGSNGIPPLRNAIISQLSSYLPYISIRNLQLNFHMNSLSVKFEFFINDSAVASIFDLTITEVNI